MELDAVPGNNNNEINSMATRCGNDINDLNTIHDHSRTRQNLEDYKDAKGECSVKSESCYKMPFDDGVEVNYDSFKEENIKVEEQELDSSIKTEMLDTDSDAEISSSLWQWSELENGYNLKLQDCNRSTQKQDFDSNEQLESIKTELDTESNVAAMQSEYNDALAVVNDTIHENSRTRHDLEDYTDAKEECSVTSESCYEMSFHDEVEMNCNSFKEERIDIEEHELDSFIKTEIFATSSDAQISCSLRQWSEFENRFKLELQDCNRSVKTELDTESNVAAMQSEYNDASAAVNDITADQISLPGPSNSDDFEEHKEVSQKNSPKFSGLLRRYNKLDPMNYKANVENCNLFTTSAESFTKQNNYVTKSQVGVVSMEPNNSSSVRLLRQRKVNVTKIADLGNVHSIKRRFKSSIKSHFKINQRCKRANRRVLNNCNQKEKNIKEKVVAKSERHSELLRDCRVVLTRVDVMNGMETQVKKSSHLKWDVNIKSNNAAATATEAEADLHSVIDCSPLDLKHSNTSALNSTHTFTNVSLQHFINSNNVSVLVKKPGLNIGSQFLNAIGKNPYKSVRSDNTCSAKDNLIKHMRIHIEGKPYKCDQCDYACSTKTNLKVHMLKHTREKPHKCDQCDYACSQKNNLIVHLRNHTGDKPYKCYQCDNAFSQKNTLITHMRKHTGEKPYKCDQCDYAFSQKNNLIVHLRNHTGDKPYKCYQCDNAFSQKNTLITHMRKHTGEKPYKCDLCDYASSLKSTLIIHIRKHTGEKPYKCDQCDYACTRKYKLIIHIMKKHTGEKPYQCDQCGFACSQKSSLIRHMRKHTGKNAYKCDQCKYACSAKTNLIKHMRNHTGAKPYKCDQCDYAPSAKRELMVHIMRKHTN